MKINPDAQAKLAALQATPGVDRVGGPATGKAGAQPGTPGAVGAVPLAPLQSPGRTPSSSAPPVGSPVTLSTAARQLASPPPTATLQWAHDVVEALTGLKLPAPIARVPARPLTLTAPQGPAPARNAPLPPGLMPAPESALFTAQGSVFTEDGQELGFHLQLFADSAPDAVHVPPVVSTVLARMLASHPSMPPLALRFVGSPSQLQSAAFEFQLEPSSADSTDATRALVGSRLLGLLVLDPQMTATYNMHLAMVSRNDPAAVLAAMGFQSTRPPIGDGVPDASMGRTCEETRCPYFGQALCPRRHCLRDELPLG
ncbi:MAG: hypothetical protein V4562_00895 [Pseudomonadota bacterium]